MAGSIRLSEAKNFVCSNIAGSSMISKIPLRARTTAPVQPWMTERATRDFVSGGGARRRLRYSKSTQRMDDGGEFAAELRSVPTVTARAEKTDQPLAGGGRVRSGDTTAVTRTDSGRELNHRL